MASIRRSLAVRGAAASCVLLFCVCGETSQDRPSPADAASETLAEPCSPAGVPLGGDVPEAVMTLVLRHIDFGAQSPVQPSAAWSSPGFDLDCCLNDGCENACPSTVRDAD